jgi:hypothetical protein
MFNKTALVAEPTPVEVATTVPTDLIPLSVLALDLPEPPAGGWTAYLVGRGLEVLTDDLGRLAVTRADARRLFDKRREDEARRREVAERQERQAVEADRAFRAALPKGLHWTAIPDGASAAQVWAQAEKDARPKRRTVLQDALEGGGGLVYHQLREDGGES